MRVTIFISFVFRFCSCFRIPSKTSHTLKTTLHDQHYFYIDAYNDIKNALVPHDVYSTVAAETANMFIRFVIKKTENKSTVKYRLDSAIFFGCSSWVYLKRSIHLFFLYCLLILAKITKKKRYVQWSGYANG